MTTIQGKVWGHTSPIFERNNVEIHRIVGKKGGYCSKHRHQMKFNKFFVERGSLEIRVWKDDQGLIDTTILGPLQTCIVAPTEKHQFRVLEDNTVAYEIYWTEINANDIVRESSGGICVERGDTEQSD